MLSLQRCREAGDLKKICGEEKYFIKTDPKRPK
jgi:hypothetical protein